MRGAGQFSNTEYVVCLECGNTLMSMPAETGPVLPNAFRRIESPPSAANE